MASPQHRLSVEGYSAAGEGPAQYQTYRPQSPSGYSTPTSATFSTGPNSPRWGSGMQSPVPTHSRPASYYAEQRTPQRRLSVPSGANPFQSPHGGNYGPPPLTPLNSSQAMFSPSSSMLTSPTTSTSGSTYSRRESLGQEDYRRRTWHPETYSSFSHPLSNVMRPGYYEQASAPPREPAPSNSVRLPGIESFDPLPPRPSTPPQRRPSPMDMEYTPSKLPAVHTSEYPRPDDRRPHSQWDAAGLHANLTRLDLTRGPPATPPTDTASSWASEVDRAVQAQGDQVQRQPSVRFEQSAYAPRETASSYSSQQYRTSAPPLTPRENKRQAWYSGPLTSPPVVHDSRSQPQNQRTSPEGSSSSEGAVPSTPGANVADYHHPQILQVNGNTDPQRERLVQQAQLAQQSYGVQGGYVPPQDSAYTYAPPLAHDRMGVAPRDEPRSEGNDKLRFETLVAVAASEREGGVAY
jgi:hypothetical protein